MFGKLQLYVRHFIGARKIFDFIFELRPGYREGLNAFRGLKPSRSSGLEGLKDVYRMRKRIFPYC